MEYTLRDGKQYDFEDEIPGLNPYSNGIYSTRKYNKMVTLKNRDVLILILMEYTLREIVLT